MELIQRRNSRTRKYTVPRDEYPHNESVTRCRADNHDGKASLRLCVIDELSRESLPIGVARKAQSERRHRTLRKAVRLAAHPDAFVPTTAWSLSRQGAPTLDRVCAMMAPENPAPKIVSRATDAETMSAGQTIPIRNCRNKPLFQERTTILAIVVIKHFAVFSLEKVFWISNKVFRIFFDRLLHPFTLSLGLVDFRL
jgi:hypothetical protein